MRFANSLGAVQITAGRWTMEVYPGENTNLFTAGDDVAAKVRAVNRFVASQKGTSHDVTAHWTDRGESVEFTLPKAALWPYSWGKLTKGNIAADAAYRISQDAINRADVTAKKAADYASGQARTQIDYADRRAAERIKQGKDAMLLAAVVAVSFAGVIYVSVSE